MNQRPTAAAVQAAINGVRAQVGDETAAVAVVTPLFLNGALIRQNLAELGPQIRLLFTTPDQIARQLAIPSLATHDNLRPPSASWTSAKLRVLLPELADAGRLDPYGDTLRLPGWKDAIQSTLSELEASGYSVVDLSRSSGHVRARLLCNIWDALESARQEEGVANYKTMASAAFRGVDNLALPINQFKGAVVFGETNLQFWVWEAFSAWCRQRPVVLVDAAPLNNLPFAPRGLRQAAGKVESIIAEDGLTTLHHVRAQVFSAATDALVDDGSVVFASTPDEIRECHEAVRRVQDAVLAGVPLERIAIIAPDAGQRNPLVGALEKAGLPYASFLGKPLSQASPAQFLLHALSIAAGNQGQNSWHDLLQTTGVRWKKHLGDPPFYRGRWRRLLAMSGAYRGPMIAQALRDLRHETVEGKTAAVKLADAVSTLSLVFESQFNRTQSWAEHAQGWLDFLRAWARPEKHRFDVESVLARMIATNTRGDVDLDIARMELEERLEQTDADESKLARKGVRVLPPMAALGGDFDLVCVLGLQQGRFPRKRAPHPYLNDELEQHLFDHSGKTIKRAPEEVEERRFAAALASAAGDLWLSIPRNQGLAERPKIPSEFALLVATAMRGHRATYDDVQALLTLSGSMSRPYPLDAERSVGALEYQVSRVANGQDDALGQLAAHPVAGRLLHLHRNLDLAVGVPSTGLAHAEDLFPALSGTPLSAWKLASLMRNPGQFFFQTILQAYGPRRLHDEFEPLGWWLDDTVAKALRIAADQTGDLGESFDAAWHELLQSVESEIPEALYRTVANIGRRHFELTRLLAGDDFGVASDAVDGVQPFAELPWVLEGQLGRVSDEQLILLKTRLPTKRDPALLAALLHSATLTAHGQELTSVKMVKLGGRTQEVSCNMDAQLPEIHAVTSIVSHGHWPFSGGSPWSLAGDDIASLPSKIDELIEELGRLQ